MTSPNFVRFLILGASALALIACGGGVSEKSDAVVKTTAPVIDVFGDDGIPHAQLPSTVVPQEYRIDMIMDPDNDGFKGAVEIDVELLEPTRKIWLHAKEMTVKTATALIDGKSYDLGFTAIPLADAPSGVAYLSSETELPKGPVTLRLGYATPYNMALNSAYKVARGEDAYIVTQFEPLGAREAFPSFDEPKYKVPFTLSITAPEDDFVYANTPETSAKKVDYDASGKTWIRHEFAKTRPLPTYLIAFGAGPYDVVDFGDIPPNSVRKRPLAQRGITAKGSGDEIRYGLAGTEPILTALEEYFGTEYPYEKLDIIAAPDYAFGAMENPGAIVYREYLMLLDENSPLSQKRAYNGVHSHELAHQWFGNLVTPVWWEDIWLNEAFATWMGNKGTALAYPEGNYDRRTLNASLGAMNIDTLSSTRKVREPLARSENVMQQFDGITYRKGGGVLDMFESFVGEEKFRDGVRLHMKRYADGVATGDDFFQSIADGSGNPDVVDAMKSFVDQPGVPLVSLATECVPSASSSKEVTRWNINQSRFSPLGSKIQQGQTWQIPLTVKYSVNNDIDETRFLLTDIGDNPPAILGCADWIMPNANGAGYYRFTLDTAGWAALIDNLDQLNTREALSTMDSLVAAFRAGEVEPSVFLDGMAKFAEHPEYDVASGSTRLIGFMYDELPDSRDDLARLVRANYRARFDRINGTDTVEGNLLAPTLAGLLAGIGQDKGLRERYARLGAKYLGLDGKADKSGTPTNMLGLALRETMRVRGDEAIEPLLKLVENGSSLEKGAATGALSATTDPKIADRLRALAIAPDSPMTGRQSNSLVNGLLGSTRHGEASWDWLKANFETYVTTKVPDVRKGGMPASGGNFCDLERRDEVRDFMTANAALIPGYERSLKQTVESIELCAALKTEMGAGLAAALKARR